MCEATRQRSSQTEHNIYNYYGWNPVWGANYTLTSNASIHHLRSTHAVNGYHIHTTNGEIGHVTDFLVSDQGWKYGCYLDRFYHFLSLKLTGLRT